MINPLQRDKNSNSHGALKNKTAFRSQSRKRPSTRLALPGFRTDSYFMSPALGSQPEPKVWRNRESSLTMCRFPTNPHSLFSCLFHFYLLIVAARTKRQEPGPWTVGISVHGIWNISGFSGHLCWTCPHLMLLKSGEDMRKSLPVARPRLIHT